MGGRVRALRGMLPAGGLPEENWRGRHRGILILLIAHAVAVPIFALAMGLSPLHTLGESAVIPAVTIIAATSRLSRRVRTVAASFGLMSSSAVLVHLSGGLIEMHFHFFVMVAVVSLYQDWIPFLAAIGYVLVHHGILGAVDPGSVFNHPAAVARPWTWAAIHALFVAGISAACLVSWHVQEAALARRREAEERLRRESRIVSRLNEVGRMLNAESDVQSVMQKVTDIATDLSAAKFGAFFYNVHDGARGSYMLYTLSGAPAEAFSSFPMPRATEIFRPTFEGDGPVRLDDVLADPRYGKNPPYNGMPPGHLAVRSYLAVPVRSSRGDVLGGLFFGHPEPGRFTEDDERLVLGIAAHGAVALDNARLHGSERRSVQRLSVMAEAGRILSSSLELDALLGDLSALIAREVTDLCVIYLRDPDGSLRAISMRAPGDASWDLDGPEALPREVSPDGPVARSVYGGETVYLPEVSDDVLEHGIADQAYRDRMRAAQPTSAVFVPLRGRHEVFGSLTLTTLATSGRRLTSEDLELAEELARRTAIAIENAHLFSTQRTAAETLQHSLLPQALPDVPGIETTARYIPGGAGVEVGGDWYDVIELPDGSLGLVMGDVVGRGVEAAALMGQLRNALRAFALEGFSTGEVITRLNRMLFELGPADGMATVIFGIYDTDTGTLRITNAGHPPPLIVGIDATPQLFEEGMGMPIGASARARYTEAITTLAPGASVILYTDGLVEDRTMCLDDGLARLTRAAAGETDLESLCDGLLTSCLEGRDAKDDIAILAMRSLLLGSRIRLRLPARARVLRPLRSTLRRWLSASGATDDEIADILVACGEACSNAIQHAGRGASDFALEAEIDDGVRVLVRDRGSWREPRPSSGGRGIMIMREIMDQVDIERTDEGTEVRMHKALAHDGLRTGR